MSKVLLVVNRAVRLLRTSLRMHGLVSDRPRSMKRNGSDENADGSRDPVEGGEDGMSKTLLVTAGADCDCPVEWRCSHGKAMRIATAADIPDELVTADQAAKVLGLTRVDLSNAAIACEAVLAGCDNPPVEWRADRDLLRDKFEEAARRVREAQKGKVDGDFSADQSAQQGDRKGATGWSDAGDHCRREVEAFLHRDNRGYGHPRASNRA